MIDSSRSFGPDLLVSGNSSRSSGVNTTAMKINPREIPLALTLALAAAEPCLSLSSRVLVFGWLGGSDSSLNHPFVFTFALIKLRRIRCEPDWWHVILSVLRIRNLWCLLSVLISHSRYLLSSVCLFKYLSDIFPSYFMDMRHLKQRKIVKSDCV